MFSFVIFCNPLITSECGTVFGRPGPEVRAEEREARRQTHEMRPQGDGQRSEVRVNLLTSTNKNNTMILIEF